MGQIKTYLDTPVRSCMFLLDSMGRYVYALDISKEYQCQYGYNLLS